MVDVIDENAINIYPDGSSYSGPRRGGVGILFVVVDINGDEVIHEVQPLGYRGATNQQMELQACIEALKLLGGKYSPVDPSDYRKILFKSDSMYVVENFRNARIFWPRAKWLTRDGTPVANASQWKELVKRADGLKMRVDFEWIKGHKGSAHNKRADRLAKLSAKGTLHKPLTVLNVRRKTTSRSIDRGSVALSGQRLTIRIITDEYYRQQRCYRYKYEVISRRSPFFRNVDAAFSEQAILLRAGHNYYVRFNSDSKNPRIIKVFREVLT